MSDIESIKRILLSAHEVVVDMNLEADLRPVAYSKAIDLFAASNLVGSHDRSVSPTGVTSAVVLKPAVQLHDSGHKLANALGIDAEIVELVYLTADDQLDVVLNRSKLPKERFPAMRMLTILVAAGRQALGLDDGWTPVDLIRDVCRDFGVLDSSNFAAAVSALGDSFVIKGKGAQRQVKVTRAGFEEAGRAILQLIGSGR